MRRGDLQMNKDLERQALEKVFAGHAAAIAVARERPDFLIKLRTGPTLGVEVTSVFSSNADAKLTHLPNYMSGLLDGAHHLHRSDRGEFKVDHVRLEDRGGTEMATVPAIILEQAPPNKAWQLFWEKVRSKEVKASSYLDACDEVDLVVSDRGRLFFHREPSDFLEHFWAFLPRRALLESPFREVHLITSRGDQEVVIPMMGNVFAADCMAFERLLQADFEAGRPWIEVFQLLAYSLFLEGHRNLMVKIQEQEWGLRSGAWEMHYSSDVHAMRDWSIPPEPYAGAHLEEMVDQMATLADEASELIARRRELLSMIDVSFPVKSRAPP